jgi:hypothetical protein
MRSAVYLKWFKEPTVANLSKLNNHFDVAELARHLFYVLNRRLRRQELMLNLSLPKFSKTKTIITTPVQGLVDIAKHKIYSNHFYSPKK